MGAHQFLYLRKIWRHVRDPAIDDQAGVDVGLPNENQLVPRLRHDAPPRGHLGKKDADFRPKVIRPHGKGF